MQVRTNSMKQLQSEAPSLTIIDRKPVRWKTSVFSMRLRAGLAAAATLRGRVERLVSPSPVLTMQGPLRRAEQGTQVSPDCR